MIGTCWSSSFMISWSKSRSARSASSACTPACGLPDRDRQRQRSARPRRRCPRRGSGKNAVRARASHGLVESSLMTSILGTVGTDRTCWHASIGAHARLCGLDDGSGQDAKDRAPDPRAGRAGASFPHSGDAEGYGDAAGPRRATTAARSGHRSARGPARRAHLVTACGARRTGPLPPGHLRTHRRMNEIVETINEPRSRVGDSSRRVFATCRSERVALHPACRGHAEHSPRPVPAGPLPGRIAQVVSH